MLTPALLSLCALAAPRPSHPVPGDTPPEGPPWLLTYREARRDALRAGRPVFVYFTKTY